MCVYVYAYICISDFGFGINRKNQSLGKKEKSGEEKLARRNELMEEEEEDDDVREGKGERLHNYYELPLAHRL